MGYPNSWIVFLENPSVNGWFGTIILGTPHIAGFIWIPSSFSVPIRSHQHCQPLSRPSRTRWTIPGLHQRLIRTRGSRGVKPGIWAPIPTYPSYRDHHNSYSFMYGNHSETNHTPIIDLDSQIWILEIPIIFIQFHNFPHPIISRNLSRKSMDFPWISRGLESPGTRPFWTCPPRAIHPPWALGPFLVPLRTDPTVKRNGSWCMVQRYIYQIGGKGGHSFARFGSVYYGLLVYSSDFKLVYWKFIGSWNNLNKPINQ